MVMSSMAVGVDGWRWQCQPTMMMVAVLLSGGSSGGIFFCHCWSLYNTYLPFVLPPLFSAVVVYCLRGGNGGGVAVGTPIAAAVVKTLVSPN